MSIQHRSGALLAALLAAALPSAEAGAQAANRSIVIVLPDEPSGLDPCNMDFSPIGRVVRQNIAETLTEVDPTDGSITPRLATAWQKVDDTTWRFTLRQGVKFSDGAAFDAPAAAKSISRIMSTTSVTNAAGAKGGLECSVRTRIFNDIQITARAVDASTLEIVSTKPDPILPTRMGIVPMASPNTAEDKLTNTPVGTGPYLYDSWTPGQEVRLKRNPAYWGAAPQVEAARYVWRNESSVRASMVRIGEADFAPTIAPQDATDPAMDFSYLNSETTWLKIDVTQPPLDDVRLRQAMNHAIDRQALIGTVFPKGVIPATQVVVPAIAGHNHDLDKKVWPYDQAKARALIAEAKAAGTDVGKQITIVGRTNQYPNAQEAMEAMMGMLQAVGFNVKLTMLEVNEWLSINRKPYKENRGPILVQSMHDNNNGDPVFSVFSRYACKGVTSTVCNEDLDKLIEKATAVSGPERVAAWKEAFRIVYEDIVPDVNMFHMVGYSRVGPRINFKPTVATNSEIQIAKMTFR